MNVKYSYKWLSSYFDEPLPSVEELVLLLTKHSFEVEGTDKLPSGDVSIELSILPNRAHDCLGHFFLAKEIGALIGKVPRLPDWEGLGTGIAPFGNISVSLLEPALCYRYSLEEVEGVSVGDSPAWLVEYLTLVGQQSINNIVDAGNFITFSINQPVHVFDKDKIEGGISIRRAKEGEVFVTLDGKELILDSDTLVIADDAGPVALAGIKGGKRAEVTKNTKNIVIESASFNARHIRKTANRLGIKTDSSKRFESEISPLLVPVAMNMLGALITSLSGGERRVEEDIYPKPIKEYKVGLPLSYTEKLLGFPVEEQKVQEILIRLGFPYGEVHSVKEVLELAPRLVGKSYLIGASVTKDAPLSFDCSSLVSYLYAEAGIWLPRMSVDQFVYGDPVEKKEMSPGDLVFANTGEGEIHKKSIECLPGTEVSSGVDHVGLYLGDGKVIHATRKAGTVVVEGLAESESFKNIVGVRRYVDKDDIRFVVSVPYERLDIKRSEDLVEEIGRIIGYDNVPGIALPKINNKKEKEIFPVLHKLRTVLRDEGFSEMYGYAFGKKGMRCLANPLQKDNPCLRENLNIESYLEKNMHWVDLFGRDSVSLFEIGTVFLDTKEEMHLALGMYSRNKKERKEVVSKIRKALDKVGDIFGEKVEIDVKETDMGAMCELSIESLIQKGSTQDWPILLDDIQSDLYSPISQFPYIVRDVSFFAPADKEGSLESIMKEAAGPLCVRLFLFDRFEKDGKLSFAYRLVFQSSEKTLTDIEVEEVFKSVVEALESVGAVIR